MSVDLNEYCYCDPACQLHEWRVNPFVILTSNPPKRQLVCAHCGAIKAGSNIAGPHPDPNDPWTWPRA